MFIVKLTPTMFMDLEALNTFEETTNQIIIIKTPEGKMLRFSPPASVELLKRLQALSVIGKVIDPKPIEPEPVEPKTPEEIVERKRKKVEA